MTAEPVRYGLLALRWSAARATAGLTSVVLAVSALAGTALADDPTEFWPELSAFVGLSPQTRLYLDAAYARGKESYNHALDVGGYLDVSLKPAMRSKLRQEDWARTKYLWARVGYVHIFNVEGGVPSPPEDRGVVSLLARVALPREVWIEGRARADLRWLSGDYSTRYRLRGEANREFVVFHHPVTPYLNVEWFYDTRYDGWSRVLGQVGTEVTFSPWLRFELYLARQEDDLPREVGLNAIGVVGKLYF